MAIWTLESCSKRCLTQDKWKIFFINFFQKMYPPQYMSYRTFLEFLEWFLIGFLQSKYL